MFGFGQKQIDIILEKLNFSRGETIRGRVVLNLKNSTRAKALKVGLIGEKTVRGERFVSGRKRTTRRKVTFFNFEMPLDGEKEYLQGEYTFEMKVPADAAQQSFPSGLAGNVLKTISILGGESSITWYVIAKLDIPMRFDVDTRVKINIG